jgi:3D (Asp-Asp-Asp) domain-containing protein
MIFIVKISKSSHMKSILLFAAVALPVAASLMSCSSSGSASNSNLKLLSKSEIAGLMSGWGSSGPGLPAEPSVSLKRSATRMPKDKHGTPTYKLSQRNRLVRTTSYSHMEGEIGAPGRMNAAGTILKYGQVRSAAADWSKYPVGTTFKIKGLPYTYVVDDYGSSLVGTNTIDIFHPSLSSMRRWATRPAEITVVHWGSWERTANLLKGRCRHSHCAQMYAGVQRKIRSGEVALTYTGRKSSL